MKRICLIAFIFASLLLQSAQAATIIAPASESVTATLYSCLKHEGECKPDLFNFGTGQLVTDAGRWDLRYGSLYAGNDLDWFSASLMEDSRSVIKDLGALSWTDSFKVPVVEPFPKLEAGQSRHFTVDTSGADGEPGAPGAVGAPVGGRNSKPPSDLSANTVSEKAQQQKPNPRTPHTDPVFVKAIAGHMYIIHVVDSISDYYALFKVETLERGDNCTISWKLIPAPQNDMSKQ